MRTFPTLYQKTQTGAIQQWSIRVEHLSGFSDYHGTILTQYGQVGGAIQETRDVIKEGKNPGKKNATTAYEQAEKEAAARWTKQKKKGYVETIAQAEAGTVDSSVILGGVAPMLAPNKCFPTDANLVKKIVFPAYIQPKLDGMRCIAMIVHGKATLWSRSRKPIRSVPHIVEALEAQFAGLTITLDGELYNHDYKNEFQALLSIVVQDEPDAEGKHRLMQYHMYDMVTDGPFSERMRLLQHLMGADAEPLYLVPTFGNVINAEAALAFQATMEEKGYEGAMIRNTHGEYESGKRSSNLQKMKSWLDGEFPILGVVEGRGKDAGTVGAFICQTTCGQEFRCRLKATDDRRTELFTNPNKWQKKSLTVRYKRFTADGIPYLPIGHSIRDYE